MTRRSPVLALVLAFVVVAALVERQGSASQDLTVTPGLARAGAVAASTGSSVWYCAAGTARGSISPVTPKPAPPTDLVAEHKLLLTNAGDDDARAHLAVYPSEGAVVRRDLDIRAHDRLDVDLAELAKAPFASAAVEVDGGRVAVAHRLRGPTLESTASCASAASRSWFFAAGSTQGNTRELLSLFNPFPQQVVADVTFQAEEPGGKQVRRRPPKLEGLVVPAERTITVDVTDLVADRPQLAARVDARDASARLVVDRVLLNPGSPLEVAFLSVAPGTTAARQAWVFADGRPRRNDLETTFALYNPTGEPVEVELRIRADGFGPPTEPFHITVRPDEYQKVTLDERLIGGSGYWAAAVARNGGAFVIERVVRAKPQPPPSGSAAAVMSPAVVDAGGVTFSPALPMLAREWIVPAAAVEGAGLVAVSNLGPGVATITVEALVDGRAAPVAGYDGVTLDRGVRTTVDLADRALSGTVPATRRSLRIRASGPVAVATTLAPSLLGVSEQPGVPVSDELTVASGEVVDLAAVAPPDAGGSGMPGPSGPATTVP